jgi:hypothetical protein
MKLYEEKITQILKRKYADNPDKILENREKLRLKLKSIIAELNSQQKPKIQYLHDLLQA